MKALFKHLEKALWISLSAVILELIVRFYFDIRSISEAWKDVIHYLEFLACTSGIIGYIGTYVLLLKDAVKERKEGKQNK